MTVLELVELKNKIEEEWGITAAAPVAVAAPAAAAAPAEAAEEKTSFDVVLTEAGGQKIQVIKVVRADHGPRPEGSEGPRRLGPEAGQGGHRPGRGRLDQGAARRGRRHRRAQVATALARSAACRPAVGQAAGRRRYSSDPQYRLPPQLRLRREGSSGTLAGCATFRPARIPLVCSLSAADYLPNFARPKGGCSS